MRWLAPYVGRHRKILLIAMLTAATWTGSMLAAPLVQKVAVDDAIVAHTEPLLPWVAAFAGLGLLRALMSATWRTYGGRLGLRVQYDIRRDMYAHLQDLDSAAHERMQSGQLVSRLNTDLNLIQQAVQLMPQVVSTGMQVVLALTIMAVLSPPLALVLGVMLVVLVLVARRLHMRVYAASWDGQQKEADMTTVAEEATTGVRVVKGFGQEVVEHERFVESLTAMFRSRVRAIRQRAPLLATLQSSPLVGQVLVLMLGGWLALNGHLTVGTFFAFLAYFADLNGSAKMLAMVLILAPRARSGTERIAEVFAVESDVQDTAGQDTAGQDTAAPDTAEPTRERTSKGAWVRYDDVRFSYPDGPEALSGFSLDVLPGETVAIVGPTGSGKTAALQLIPRLRDASAGRVMIDGSDVRDLSLSELRSRISMVFDEAMLLSGSIRDNIAYGNADATDEQIERVAKIAQIHDFIVTMPEGYETEVGQSGFSLSGGQRQRVALARALLAEAELLVLDDATSAVDVRVEGQILQAMQEIVADRSVIVVAYRESTVKLADRIVVVDGGRIVEEGTHEDLVGRSQLYRELMSEVPDDGEDVPELAPDEVTESAWTPAEHAGNALRARVGDPVSPELLGALGELPPATDASGVDVEYESTRRDGFRFWQLIQPRKWWIAFGLFLLMIESAAMLTGPLLVRSGLEHSLENKSLLLLVSTAAIFAAVAAINFGDVWASHFVTSKTSERILYAVRIRLFGHLQRLGMDYYDKTHAGRVMTRLTSDVDAVTQLVQGGLSNALVGITTFTGMTAVLLVLNPTLALVVLAVIPPATAATFWYRRVVGPAYERSRELNSMLNTYLHETLGILPVTQSFRREAANLEHFRGMANEQLDMRTTAVRATSIYVAFIELLGALSIAATLLVGWGFIQRGEMDVAQLVPFLLYLALAFAPIQQMATVFDIYQRAKTGLRRISALLAEEVTVPAPEQPTEVGELRGDIELRGTSLQYRGTAEPALRAADLHITPGERVAFVGQTGAGKSTIAKVITRFYEASDGSVEIDGVPVTAYDPSDYRQRIGYVPQEPFLFSRSIRDNIAYGKPDASDELVEAAARAVGAHEFIARLDGGYLHEVQERGKSLSAGQRQLLCLARAIVMDPRVLVLDEATSHLDLASERRVEQAMQTAARGRTTIVIAHRPQTLRWVDRVVTVHKGELVDDRPTGDRAEEQFSRPEELVGAS